MSFRTRLLLTALTTLAVGLGALVVIGNVLLDHRVATEASDLLQARADAQVAALDVRGGRVRVREVVGDDRLDERSWVIDAGRVLERPRDATPQVDRAAVAAGLARARVEREVGDDVRVKVVPVGARGAVVVSLSTGPLERLQKEVLLGSLVVAGFVLLAGGLAIRSAVEGALRPVSEMTAAAASWGAGDLDRRFAMDGGPKDELTGLAATLDGLLGRIAASRRHEQRFASEVAHELRTPVAGLRGRAELALRSDDAAEREAALEAVIAQAGRLDATIDALLAVARHELDPASGAVDLVALAREVEGVEVVAPDGLPAAEGEPDVVRRALAPLVENARRHAATSVRLVLAAGDGKVRLAVRDDGPGVDPALGDRAFDPGVRGPHPDPEGAGLGLALARRLARSCGGDVVLGAGPGGDVVLELPALR